MGKDKIGDIMAASVVAEGDCTLLLHAPDDERVYGCFRQLAQRWAAQLTAQRLWLEYDVVMQPEFLAPQIPDRFKRLFAAAPTMIRRIELELGGVSFKYVRSGGHLPYRRSYFDELHVSICERASIAEEALAQMFAEIAACLDIAISRGSSILVEKIAKQTHASGSLRSSGRQPD